MNKRKVAFRKNRQNRLSMFLVTVVVLMMLLVVSVKSVDLKSKMQEYALKEETLNSQIEAEKQRTEEIEEYGKYTQTMKYKEEVAKDKLGLVREGEIVFKEED